MKAAASLRSFRQHNPSRHIGSNKQSLITTYSAKMAGNLPPSQNEHDGVLALVNKQFELYNARNLDKFMELFAEDIVVIDAITDEVLARNKAQVRQRYEKRFSTPVHAELLGRLVLGPVVHDREVIFGLPDNGEADCLATYVIDTKQTPYLIKKMKFVWTLRS